MMLAAQEGHKTVVRLFLHQPSLDMGSVVIAALHLAAVHGAPRGPGSILDHPGLPMEDELRRSLKEEVIGHEANNIVCLHFNDAFNRYNRHESRHVIAFLSRARARRDGGSRGPPMSRDTVSDPKWSEGVPSPENWLFGEMYCCDSYM